MFRLRILCQGLVILLLPALAAASLLAQTADDDFAPTEEFNTVRGRYQGDIGLQVNGYLWVPLFNIAPNDTQEAIKNTNLSLGGGADLAVIYYLTANLGIGGFLDLGITAPSNQANIQNYFLAVLLGPRISYDINIYTPRFTLHPLFSIPLGFGIAASATKFGDITNIMPVFKLDAGFYINPFKQPEWSFGLSLHYWFTPEFTKTELSRIGNYLMIGIGFNFHSGF